MRLTQFSDYSLRILITLALDAGRRFTISELSKRHRISQHHLTKVVHRLASNGFIETTRGQGGGVCLARNTKQVTIGKIVRTTEPDFALAECFQSNGKCRFETNCTLQTVLGDSLKAFFAVLDRYTLADLVQNPLPLSRLIYTPELPRKSPPQFGKRKRS